MSYSMHMFDERSWSTRLKIILLIVLTIGLLLPFINKAFHMDDPFFLWAARQIQSHPLDPYGFRMVWYFKETEASQLTKHPPLAAYYIALVTRLLPWSEQTLHIAFMVPALGVILGTFFLARALCSRPFLAAVSVLAMPGFFVQATTVMSDVMMLALWIWASVLWTQGLEKKNNAYLLLSVFLAALSALTKYYAMSLIPLFFFYGIIKRKGVGVWALYLLVPLVAAILYDVSFRGLYGYSALWSIASSVPSVYMPKESNIFARCLVTLSFIGGCTSVVLFYLPFLRSWRSLLMHGIILVVIVVALTGIKTLVQFPLQGFYAVDIALIMQLGIFIFAGYVLSALIMEDIIRGPINAESLLLVCWAVGAAVFVICLNWSVTARAVLPIAPAAAIFLVRSLERRPWVAGRPFICFLPMIPALILSLGVSYGDYTLANSGRAVARTLSGRYGKEMTSVRFQGHWGFQYYMQSNGFTIGKPRILDISAGDIIIVPENNYATFAFPEYVTVRPEGVLESPVCPWITTQRILRGAGFYSDVVGPLPYSIGPVPPERYSVVRIVSTDDPGAGVWQGRAIAGCTASLMRNSNDANTYLKRGDLLSAEKKYDKAISDYTEALIIGSFDIAPYIGRGHAYLAEGVIDKAHSDFVQALRIYPQCGAAYEGEAYVYFSRGEYSRARRDAERAQDLGRRVDPEFLKKLDRLIMSDRRK